MNIFYKVIEKLWENHYKQKKKYVHTGSRYNILTYGGIFLFMLCTQNPSNNNNNTTTFTPNTSGYSYNTEQYKTIDSLIIDDKIYKHISDSLHSEYPSTVLPFRFSERRY